MWLYILLTLQRQRGKNILVSSGFLLAACGLVLLSATTNTVDLQGTQAISQNWRPTYDLVVVPSQTAIAGQQTVPSDVLSGYNGGISMTQYEQIKTLPGIAIAAPIAYIGYFNLPTPAIHIYNDSASPGYYREVWTQTSYNGQHKIVEQQITSFIFLDGSNACHFAPSDAAAWRRYNERVAAYAKQGIEYACASYGNNVSFYAQHISPITEKFLLAAIDPTAENLLVHLGASINKGRMLTEQDTAQVVSQGSTIYGQKSYSYQFPILINAQLPSQTTTHLSYARLLTGTLTPDQVTKQGGVQYLKTLHDQQRFLNQDIPPAANSYDEFSNINLEWDGHAWTTDISGPQAGNAVFSYPYQPSSLTYQTASGPTENTDPAYKLLPTGTQGPEVTFRNLNTPRNIQKPSANAVVDYLDQPIGQFAGAQLTAQFNNPLNWLPENTYTVPPGVLRYDAQGRSIAPVTMLPTANTAGYVIQPPLALTTLKAAEHLLGDNFINAIRIRVSGVEQANQESWMRIQQVAAQIEQKTHLRVLVTLGSSPKPVLVFVPGLKKGKLGATQDIAPVGWVEERWIFIGASIHFLQQLSLIRILLLGAVLGVCLCYFQVSLSALESAQRREFTLLSALGWRPWQPAFLFLIQALVLALLGGTIGLLLGLLATIFLKVTPLWPVVFGTLPVMLGLAALSALAPLRRLGRLQPAKIVERDASFPPSSHVGRRRRLPGSGSISLGSLSVHNLTRAYTRTLITGSTLFLSAALLVLMINSILSLRQQLSGSLLGDFVLLQTAIPQLAGCLVAVMLAFLSVADLLLLQVRERRHEVGLLQAVGWQARHVQRLFVREGIMLAALSTLPGVLVAQGLLVFLQPASQQLLPTLFIAFAVLAFLISVAAMASLPALYVLRRMPVVTTLQAG